MTRSPTPYMLLLGYIVRSTETSARVLTSERVTRRGPTTIPPSAPSSTLARHAQTPMASRRWRARRLVWPPPNLPVPARPRRDWSPLQRDWDATPERVGRPLQHDRDGGYPGTRAQA